MLNMTSGARDPHANGWNGMESGGTCLIVPASHNLIQSNGTEKRLFSPCLFCSTLGYTHGDISQGPVCYGPQTVKGSPFYAVSRSEYSYERFMAIIITIFFSSD